MEVLLSEPTDDSVEIAVNFVKEVGQLLEVRSATHTTTIQEGEEVVRVEEAVVLSEAWCM